MRHAGTSETFDQRGDRLRTESLLRDFAASRSPALRERIVERFMPLARSLARQHRGGAEPVEDLIQVASLGLVKAVDRFDLARGTPFPAFAVPTIRGELRRHFRDHGSSLRLPRGLGELTIRVDRAADDLTAELGRAPNRSQIAAYLGVATEQVAAAISAAAARRTLSFDAPRRDLSDRAVRPAIEMVGAERGYAFVETQIAAGDADLDDREWDVLRLRFVEGLSQRQIGRRIGVSQMQVSRISRRALWKLLAAVRGEQTSGPPPRRARRLNGSGGDRTSFAGRAPATDVGNPR